MKYKLINPPNGKYTAKGQILINRGMKEEDLTHYMSLTDDDINDPEVFGKELLHSAWCQLYETMAISDNKDICIIVDCDCDGYTSAAILINYLYVINSKFTENHVHWFMHDGKQHGLADAMDWIDNMNPDLVIVPDAGSNDKEQMQKLYDDGRKIIILDHHEIEGEPFKYCYLINSQSPEYPNKFLSGAGVVYQFCRYIDKVTQNHAADFFLDLCALGLIGDMMSLQSFETRRLIDKGIAPSAINNPFIYSMWQKNKFKLGEVPTAWGFTFYIVPFVNAITRSGTLEEKELVFNSMLFHKANQEILSNKRGHKVGEKEKLVEQAVRTCTNVKNRQTRAEDAGIELVKGLIEENHMMDHKVLLFLLEPGQIKPEIRGLIANKIMARYQRPCCMLTKITKRENVLVEGVVTPSGELVWAHKSGELFNTCGKGYGIAGIAWGPGIEEYITYEGSARGCDKVGITEFKDVCAETQVCDYTIGHQGAFGLGLPADKVEEFLNKTDEILKDMPNEPIYYVDYIWDYKDIDAQAILDIGEMAAYWGKDVDEAIVAVKGIRITKDMLHMMASNTMKISLPNNINIIKFRTPDEEFNKLYSENGYVEIDAICKANINEWNGTKYPQLFLEDYNINNQCAYIF